MFTTQVNELMLHKGGKGVAPDSAHEIRYKYYMIGIFR